MQSNNDSNDGDPTISSSSIDSYLKQQKQHQQQNNGSESMSNSYSDSDNQNTKSCSTRMNSSTSDRTYPTDASTTTDPNLLWSEMMSREDGRLFGSSTDSNTPSIDSTTEDNDDLCPSSMPEHMFELEERNDTRTDEDGSAPNHHHLPSHKASNATGTMEDGPSSRWQEILYISCSNPRSRPGRAQDLSWYSDNILKSDMDQVFSNMMQTDQRSISSDNDSNGSQVGNVSKDQRREFEYYNHKKKAASRQLADSSSSSSDASNGVQPGADPDAASNRKQQDRKPSPYYHDDDDNNNKTAAHEIMGSSVSGDSSSNEARENPMLNAHQAQERYYDSKRNNNSSDQEASVSSVSGESVNEAQNGGTTSQEQHQYYNGSFQTTAQRVSSSSTSPSEDSSTEGQGSETQPGSFSSNTGGGASGDTQVSCSVTSSADYALDDDDNEEDDDDEDDQQGQWQEKFLQLARYKEQYGDCNPKACPTLSAHATAALTLWIKRQRYHHKRKQNGKPHRLTPEREEALSRLGFVWDVRRTAWDEKFDELREFVAEHGHANVPINYKKNRRLGIWVKHQRRQHKLSTATKRRTALMAERFAQLKFLGLDFCPPRGGKRQRSPKADAEAEAPEAETLMSTEGITTEPEAVTSNANSNPEPEAVTSSTK